MMRLAVAFLLLACHGVAANTLPALGSTVGLMDDDIAGPGPGFPGATAALSNAAFPGGVQPPKLRYWPQLRYGQANRTLLGCWKTQILHSTDKGWPGMCVNLIRKEGFTTEQECGGFCVSEPRCSVWQLVNQTDPDQCWIGFGTDCLLRSGRNDEIQVKAAQRLMHGEVHVMMYLKGWKVNNLFQIGSFHQSGDPQNSEQLSIERCKAWCYSSIACQYWQYSAAKGGCFVDAPMFSTNWNSDSSAVVQYPLTTNGGVTQDPDFQYGEYIVHYCPVQPASTTPAPSLPSYVPPTPVKPIAGSTSSGFTTWLFGGFIVLAGLGGIAYYAWTQNQQGGGGSKRKAFAPRNSPDVDYNDNFEEDKPLMMVTPQSSSPASFQRAPNGQFDSARSGAASGRPGQLPPPPGQMGQRPGYGQPAGSFQQRPGMAGSTLPPPTQMVDFGQNQGGAAATMSYQPNRPQGANLAPTQLLNQGMPFPSPGMPYQQQQNRSGLM